MATGQTLRAPRAGGEIWPHGLEPDLTDVQIAVARTVPAYGGEKEVREIETLFRDAIAAARRSIYIENQYLSSAAIGDALVRRLEEPEGPEIVIVISQASYGWLEGATMDVIRGRLMRRLCVADRHKRLRVYAAIVSREAKHCMSVHSKLLVVDTGFVRVGSANLSNRSMGFDTECDVAIESNGRREVEEAIARFRNTLLAEHLGASREEVAAILRETGIYSYADGLMPISASVGAEPARRSQPCSVLISASSRADRVPRASGPNPGARRLQRAGLARANDPRGSGARS